MKTFIINTLFLLLFTFIKVNAGTFNILNIETHNSQSMFSLSTDTLYTEKDYFIEVNLFTQTAVLHSRKDSAFTFKVSTGNSKLEKGVETKSGLFVIQSMMPKTYSRQFDSTVMLNWMGFNYGIGFHGLLGNSYYKYLGKKRSSHGCVRVARKDVEYVYKKISVGTPVLIHNNYDNLIFVSFSSDSAEYVKPDSKELAKLIENELTELNAENPETQKLPKILIDNKNITHAGLPIGKKALNKK